MKNSRGLGFITIMIIIAVAALIIRVAVEQIIKINITQNDAHALATLKLISTALENYAKEHLGGYPPDFSFLTKNTPSYLDKDYLREPPLRGYDYNCSRLENTGYSCSAQPLNCGFSGGFTHTVTTGGIIVSEPCPEKEKK
jgi:competence protein ComGC